MWMSRVLGDDHYERISHVTVGVACYLKIPHCSVAMSAEHRSKFSLLHRQWWRLRMSEKFSSRTKTQNKHNKNIHIKLTYKSSGIAILDVTQLAVPPSKIHVRFKATNWPMETVCTFLSFLTFVFFPLSYFFLYKLIYA